MFPNKFSDVDVLLYRDGFISLYMHSMVHGVERGMVVVVVVGGAGGIGTAEFRITASRYGSGFLE